MSDNNLTDLAGTLLTVAVAYKVADSAFNKPSRRKGKRTNKAQKRTANNLHDIFGF